MLKLLKQIDELIDSVKHHKSKAVLNFHSSNRDAGIKKQGDTNLILLITRLHINSTASYENMMPKITEKIFEISLL